jgi:hypothetical protein
MLAYEDWILTRVDYDLTRNLVHEAAYVEARKRFRLVRAGEGKAFGDEIVERFKGLEGKRKLVERFVVVRRQVAALVSPVAFQEKLE